MFKRIDHVEIVAQDLDRSIRFYTEILGFSLKERMKVPAPPLEEIAYLSLGDTVLELMRVKDAAAPTTEPWSTGYRMMALEVDDMDRALAYLGEKGISATWGPVTLGASKRAEIRDPDGLSIELRQWQQRKQMEEQMIPEKMMEVLQHEGVVAIATQGEDGPHLVNSWNSYVQVTDAGAILIPAGYMHVTEENIKRNPKVLLTLGSREVAGAHGPGTGFLVEGTAAFVTSGANFEVIKCKFHWARAALEVTVSSVTQTL